MRNVWRAVLITCGVLALLGVVLMVVSYATGGSVRRVLASTDITDMTKFISRSQLEYLLSFIF